MRAYSADLRLRVLAACDGGLGTAEAADTFAVSEAWVRRIKQRRRDAGEVTPRLPSRAARPPVLEGRAAELAELVRSRPGLTAAAYRPLLGTPAAVVTVWRMLRRLGLTHKKVGPRGRAGPAGLSPPAG